MAEEINSISDDNRRIAKNTLFLYIRMFFAMGVSLYTSRVILDTLGIIDYGIWNVVAGVIAMFSFLNTSMSTATSRFLMFELGKDNKDGVQKVFSSACTIHLLVALLVMILGETVGLWFLYNKLVIPEERLFASFIVYQITILSTMIGITQVPYNASIMANEKMDVYAYIEMANICLRLLIVFALIILPFDKLIVYGILTLIVSFSIAMTYRFYCSYHFFGCKYILSKDWAVIKPMLSFSGWDLYGNLSVVARTQGVNMLLNMFFTVAMNAASGIASQVQGAVMGFAGNVVQAFRPQIVKSYASADYGRMSQLISKAAQYTTMLLLLFTIPLCMEIDYVLSLWLKKVPNYAAIFCVYTLAFNIFTNIAGCVVYGIHATGKVKRVCVINGTIYLLVIPISYISYKLGGEPQIAFIFNVLAVVLGMLSNIYTLHIYVPEFKIKSFITSSLFKPVLITIVVISASSAVNVLMQSSFLRLLINCCVSFVCISLTTFYFIMNRNERIIVLDKMKRIYNGKISKYFNSLL